MSIADEIYSELDDDARDDVDGKRRNGAPAAAPKPRGDGPFDRANAVPIADVCRALGIVVDGDFATCPGCGESGASLKHAGGLKCSHRRCENKGKAKGFRTPVDLVMEVRNVGNKEAVLWLAERFHFEADFGKKKNEIANEKASIEPIPTLGFTLLGPDAIFAKLEEPDYLVDGIIRRGSLTEIVAYGSSGKTWVTVDMALSVAAGMPWLEKFPTKQGLASYLDYENGSYEMRRRIQARAGALSLTTPINGIDVACMPEAYMSDPTFPARLVALAKQRDLIIVDTLKAADPGTDENDSRIRLGLDTMRRVGETTGCAFVTLVHSKKTSGSPTTIDAREAGRGSSAIFDAADAVFHIQYREGEPLRVTQTKARLGRTVAPFIVRIEDTATGTRVWAEDVPASQTDDALAKFDAICTLVLDAVRRNPASSKRLLAEKVGKRFGTVSAALENLQRNGAVTNNDDRWFATKHEVSDDDDE